MREKAPVLFIFFNRLNNSLLTFSKIKEYKPSKLYLAADGARSSEEKEVCDEIRRRLLEEIDWECEVNHNFSNINLGARYRIESAINWAFLKEEMLIILEDDCLASPSFFPYCETLLERYKEDTEILMISGTNEAIGVEAESSYCFSRLPHTWGWATWKRAWKLYDYELTLWKNHQKVYKKLLAEQFNNDLRMYAKRMNEIDWLFKEKVDAWDYRWFLAFHFHNGISIAPSKNLISNIGFGSEATHTFDENSSLSNLPIYSLNSGFGNKTYNKELESAFHEAYLDNRISRYNAYIYILKMIFSYLDMNYLTNELSTNNIKSFFMLGTKGLGKSLTSKLSSIIEFNGFCGNDVSPEVFEEWLLEKTKEERSATIIISSIEGVHEKEIISIMKENIPTEIKIISWKNIVRSYISDTSVFRSVNDEELISHIEENMYHLIEKDII